MSKLLDVRDLYKVYNPDKAAKRVVAVDHVSFSAEAGEIVGILGPNGSGKTSTIKSIASVIDFEGGSISLNGYDVRKQRRQVVARIGAVLEGARNIYWTLTPVENMVYFAALKGLSAKSVRPRIDQYLHLLDLEAEARKPVRTFSKGMQQKVAIACALIGDPAVVLLDEPTLGLDVETARTMQAFVREISHTGKLVIITSHDMRFIEKTCDRVLVVKKGRIIAQDSIQGLNAFFRKKVYRLVLNPPLSAGLLAALESVGQCRREELDGQQLLYYVLENERELYAIFDLLKQHDAALVSLDIQQDDFEDIFLSIVNEVPA